MRFETFQKKCQSVNLIASDKGNGHWQVRGRFLVNYYPSTGKCYIAGTAIDYLTNQAFFATL